MKLLKLTTALVVIFTIITASLFEVKFGMVQAFAANRYEDLQLFTKVLNLVQRYYVEEVDTGKLIRGGIKGMLKELDPHTNYLPVDVFKEFESETSGEFGGLGIEITIQKGILTVISPIEDTPAWIAGIKAGDMIVRINGESTKGISLVEAAQKMKGKKGSPVVLGIYREGFDKPKDFSITRAVVKLKSVKYLALETGYVYFRITSFMENTWNQLNEYIEKYKKGNEIKGLILDLRRNPGGLLDQAIKVSDLFLSEGVIVSTVGRNKKEKEVIYAKKKGTLTEFPIVVIIDEYSASASEIVAGALQDNKRALVMGKKSFGKGSVQSVVKLGDGSGLKLTVARYYTPSGRSIQAEGVVPDLVVEDYDVDVLAKATKEKGFIQREKDMKGHLKGEKELAQKDTKDESMLWWLNSDKKDEELSAKDKLLKEDFQVIQALNYLKAYKVMKSL